MWTWIKSIFLRNSIPHPSEPIVEVYSTGVQEPCVRITVGKKSMLLSGAQARRLWGKLGANLEKMTIDE